MKMKEKKGGLGGGRDEGSWLFFEKRKFSSITVHFIHFVWAKKMSCGKGKKEISRKIYQVFGMGPEVLPMNNA